MGRTDERAGRADAGRSAWRQHAPALDISTKLLKKHRRGDEDAHVRGPEVHGLDEHVRTAYDADDGTLVLVRPDGYVGLITDSGERVTEYVKTVGDVALRTARVRSGTWSASPGT